MASIISVDTLQDSAGSNEITTANVKTAFDNSAKVWAKYGMDDATIDDSYNLSSLTDNGTGDFTNTWTNAFGSINYTHLANASIGTGASSINKQDFYTPSTSSVRLYTTYHNGSSDGGTGTAYDYQLLSLIAHGDLA